MNALTISSLNFSYGQEKVLNSLSLEIEEGQFYTVLGPNGSGKTTLLRHIQKLILPEKASVFIGEEDVRKIKVRDLAKAVSVVPQETHLEVDFSVLDYVLTGRSPYLGRFEEESQEDYDRARKAMLFTNTWQFRNKSVRALSGGEFQRVIVSRAMVQETEILLLDEPVSHLDLKHQIMVLNQVRAYSRRKRTTVIAVLHDINLAASYSDVIILVRDGEIYAMGAAEEVLTETSLREVYGMECIILENPLTGKPYIIPKSVQGE